jgi:general stress protein 26
MENPATLLDSRFSAPEAVATDWRSTLETLRAAELFWIVTVRADGRPHASPLVAVWLEGAVHFTTGVTEQKARNLETNPQVILMTGCNTWDQGLDVVVEGNAVRQSDRQILDRLAELWTTKWDGRWRYTVSDDRFHHGRGEALVYSVAPRKVLAFGKGTFSQTRHLP